MPKRLSKKQWDAYLDRFARETWDAIYHDLHRLPPKIHISDTPRPETRYSHPISCDDDLYALEEALERRHGVYAPLSGRDALLEQEADRYYLGED